MIVDKFSEEDLDNLMIFLDDNITENYEREVFLTIRKRWPEGFLVVRNGNEIAGVACGAIQPNSKLRILIIALANEFLLFIKNKRLIIHNAEFDIAPLTTSPIA